MKVTVRFNTDVGVGEDVYSADVEAVCRTRSDDEVESMEVWINGEDVAEKLSLSETVRLEEIALEKAFEATYED